MLELRNISFEVSEEANQKEIVRDISLTVENHKFTVIIIEYRFIASIAKYRVKIRH